MHSEFSCEQYILCGQDYTIAKINLYYQVLVSVEYVRGEDSNKRLFASVLYGKLSKQRSASATTNLNIAEQLVIEGLATTVKHRGK